MKRKTSILLLMLFIFSLILQGCGSNSKEVGKEEKTISLGTTGYFFNETWDPVNGYDSMAIQSYGVGETLFRLDENYKIKPWLVDSFEQKDDFTWEITLKDGIVFHNEKPVTGEAVKKCFERSIKENSRALDLIKIKEIQAEGQKLIIKTEAIVPTLINDLADPVWVVYDAESTEDFKEITYYTGPYKIGDFEANVELTVEKFEHYWGEKSNIDKAIFKTYSDDDSLLMALQSGEVDIMIPMSAANYNILKTGESKKFEVVGSTSSRGQFLQLNLDKPIFKDKNVRKAIYMCMDREKYAEEICYGRDTPGYTIFPDSLSFGGHEKLNLESTEYSVEKAKKLLEEAGYVDSNQDGTLDKDGVELTFSITTFSNYTSSLQLFEVMQEDLKEIGIGLEIHAVENPNDYVHSGDFFVKGASYITAPTGTSNYFLNILCKTEGEQNYGHYSNPEVDKLIEALSIEKDEATRDDLTRKISELVANDYAFLFYNHEKFSASYNKEVVENFYPHPSELYILDTNTRLVEE